MWETKKGLVNSENQEKAFSEGRPSELNLSV